MEECDARVADLAQRLQAKKHELAIAKDANLASAEALRKFLATIQSFPSSFDDEDIAMVSRSLKDREAVVKEHEIQLRATEEVREERDELFYAMRTVLAERTSLLEAADDETGVLVGNLTLLEYFAQKHVGLTRLLEAKMAKTLRNLS